MGSNGRAGPPKSLDEAREPIPGGVILVDVTRSGTPPDDGKLDVAIVGAGAAGTYVAYRLIQARPDWRIAVFERSNRIGGRLWSVPIEGLAHPIELGGMRYMTGHLRVHSVVTELGIETRHFDPAHRPERLFLRGIVGESPDDPNAGSAHDLPAGEAGRSATDLMRGAFLKIVPLARELDDSGWRQLRSTATLGGRRLTSMTPSAERRHVRRFHGVGVRFTSSHSIGAADCAAIGARWRWNDLVAARLMIGERGQLVRREPGV